jgi:RHS repeat-associated protein
MQYDLQGNRTKLIDPDAGTIRTQYNGFGELILEKQLIKAGQDSVATINTYDETTGLLQTIERGTETTSYGYDNLKRLSTIEIAGKHKQTFTYGDFDRITDIQEEIGTRVYTKHVDYDALGRPIKEIFPSNYYTTNTYDDYGNLTEVKDVANRSIWKAVEANARGQLTKVDKGIKQTIYGYDDRGMTTSIQAAGVVDMSYVFDTNGNLFSRTDALTNQKEQFGYDALNRLTNWDIHQSTTNNLLKANSITYDPTTGNITGKSDLGNFTLSYGGKRPDGSDIGPHALATISGMPTCTPSIDLNVTYTDFKKIATLSEGTKSYAVTYGVDQQRRKSVQTIDGVTKTRYYLGDYEEEIVGTTIRKIHYLSGGAVLVNNNGVETLYYGYTDNQGSLIALTNESGTVVEKYAYDPWGARRNPADWKQNDTRTSWITNRGYTGHEHIDQFGIINMNGRVYDPQTAMFMNPDPLVQSPDNWINYNRYSYCFNNPLIYTDPSGYLNDASSSSTNSSESSRFHSWKEFWDITNYIWDNTPNDGGGWSNGSQTMLFNSTSQVADFMVSRLNQSTNLKAYTLSYRERIYILIGNGDPNKYKTEENGSLTFSGLDVITPFLYSNLVGGWDGGTINTTLGALSTLNGIGINIAKDYVSYGFKSANGWQEFGKLASNQQAWRAASVLGKTGANVLKYAKVAGKAAGLVGVALTAYQGFSDGNFTTGDAVKIGIGLVTTFTPYGWVYGVADLGVQAMTGQSITDRVGDFIDN